MVVNEFATFEQVVDKAKALLRLLAHGHCNGAVEFYNRRWLDAQQPVVECRDLPPVRGCRGGSVCMYRRNGRLQRVGAETARGKGTLRERDAFGDLVSVP